MNLNSQNKNIRYPAHHYFHTSPHSACGGHHAASHLKTPYDTSVVIVATHSWNQRDCPTCGESDECRYKF